MNWTTMATLGFCLAFSTQAFGQAAPKPGTMPLPPAAAAPAPAPDRTTASFGDWVLRCDRRADVTPPQRFCELGQTVQRQGEAGPQAQLAVGRILPTDPIRITLLLPINVAFDKGPKLTGDTTSLDLAWVRCLPTGCFANGIVSDDVLRKLRTIKDAGRIEYRDGTGREVALPISFRGFGEALDAFNRESSN
jgi:invasion protein IalB